MPKVVTATDHLRTIERERGVRVLYACEAGSRAWGFASQDSDHDVRFIYCHPPAHYLAKSIWPKRRDVIELPLQDGDLDISGWDLPKALGLMRKGNPPLMEWIHSPIAYDLPEVGIDPLRFLDQLKHLAGLYWSPTASYYHYYNMARRNWAEYLQGEQVRTKKYLYVIRPLLCVRWVVERQSFPPVLMGDLVECAKDDTPFYPALCDLLTQKKAGMEDDYGPRIPALSDWIDAEMERLKERASQPEQRDAADLEAFMLETLCAVWGPEF